MSGLLPICGCDNPTRRGDVVFVHGAHGGWRNFPQWIGEDIRYVGVWLLEYEAFLFKWEGERMSLTDLATNTLEELTTHRLGSRPIVFVAHSVGGLLVKKLLCLANERGARREILEQTKGVVFISTPHLGIRVPFFLIHRKAKDVEIGRQEPRQLMEAFRQLVLEHRIGVEVLYEQKKTRGLIILVDSANADPGIPGVVPTPVNEDHVSICQPGSRDSLVFERVREFTSTRIKGRPELFVSYAHEDQQWKDRLVTRLRACLEARGERDLTFWDDSLIPPGYPWLQAIETALAAADIAFLLVTEDFLSSRFITSKEVPGLLNSYAANGLPIYPVILKTCDWERSEGFREVRSIQVFPRDHALFEGSEARIGEDLAQLADATLARLRQCWPGERT